MQLMTEYTALNVLSALFSGKKKKKKTIIY